MGGKGDVAPETMIVCMSLRQMIGAPEHGKE